MKSHYTQNNTEEVNSVMIKSYASMCYIKKWFKSRNITCDCTCINLGYVNTAYQVYTINIYGKSEYMMFLLRWSSEILCSEEVKKEKDILKERIAASNSVAKTY